MRIGTVLLETPLGPVQRVAVRTPFGIVDATAARICALEKTLPEAAALRVGAAQVPPNLVDVIATGPQAMEWIRESVDGVGSLGQERTAGGMRTTYEAHEVKLLSPIPRPPGIACFVTWPAHIQDSREKGFTMLNFPPLDGDMRAYYKANPDSVIGTGEPLRLPSYADEYDVECEFAAIVGNAKSDLTADEARRAIAGYCIYNDVSFRTMQNKEMAFGLGPAKGKDADYGNVLGPWMVTPDEIGDVHDLTMSFHLNGVEQSSYSTSKMAWDHADLLSYLSRGQTLRPGHILTSGCYPGGSALDLGIKLAAGDEVEMRIDTLGAITNALS